MLILARRTNQSINIGPNIVIRVVEIRGDSVRLGITAPTDIQVDREEVAVRRVIEARAAKLDLSTQA